MEETHTIPGIKFVNGFFWGVLVLAIALALLILVIPASTFLAYSNYLQIIASLAGAVAFFVLWNRSEKQFLLLAGTAFLLWGVSNIGWYIYALTGQRSLVFPSIIDAGIIASIFLLAAAYKKGLPDKTHAPWLSLSGIIACLIIPVVVIFFTGMSAATLVLLLYFLACGGLLLTGLNHSLMEHPVLLVGTLFFAVAFLIYPLREMFFASSTILSVIGTFVSAGFALIVLGLVQYFVQEETT